MLWPAISGDRDGRIIILLLRGTMQKGKNLQGERINLMDTSGHTTGNRMRAADHQFCKLIEYDEGIPFQLRIGDMPGEGNFLYIGNGIRKLTGIDPYTFTEATFLNMVEEIIPLSASTPSDISVLRRMLVNGDISDYRIELRIKTASGETKWLRETSMTVRDEVTGDVTGIIGILHDVSERRRVLANLDEARKKASESEKLKTSFLQNISHEVRTPLNAIVGFSTLLCDPEAEYGRKKEFASMINNSTDHFLEIMDNIMEIARIEAGSSVVALSETNIHHLMHRLHRSFALRFEEKNLQLICSIPEETNIVIRTDSFKLFQILNNIIANALKFTPSGSVEFGFKTNAGRVEFFVSDTGLGISDINRRMIFNKFYQVDSDPTRSFPGIGLGLTISKEYIEMLGGSIWCESKIGEGSTFRFWLPR